MGSEKETKEEKVGKVIVISFAVLVIVIFIYVFTSIQL